MSSSEYDSADENSAVRYENETYEEAAQRHSAIHRSKYPEAFDSAVSTAEQSQVPVDKADLSRIPVWNDSEIVQHFERTRDLRFLSTSDRPWFSRRLSWLYPDDGCYARAELVSAKADEWLHKRPYRLFAFGNLLVNTPNYPSGKVQWWYHTVPVVKKASTGEPVVFDAALDPRRPIPWRQWLALQVSNLNDVRVSVCDGNTYGAEHPCFGAPARTAEALSDQKNRFLGREWIRQVEMLRDPLRVLGDSPPW
ncbi:hypothetical protein LZC95_02175 [Pendulispora brunnea]|uniref:Protein glutaminase domain-containing protein n=1 Tax=Pendulispora brunnea TaxID=2905690 RepID=A0ABZ2KEA1_9BACT